MEVSTDYIEKNKRNFLKVKPFDLILSCIILSLLTGGVGSSIFGLQIFTNVSTLFVYLTFIIQILTHNIRFSKFLAGIYIYIIIQSYIINLPTISFISSIKHFIGVILFSISTFSFVSVFRDEIPRIVKIYYKFTFIIALIGFSQVVLFVFFGVSFIPQNIISGTPIAMGKNSFSPEIFGILPRAIGLSTEPAHYSILLLPGAFIALLTLQGKVEELAHFDRRIAWIILLGFILSFSLVGFVGLALSFFTIFSIKSKGKKLVKLSILVFFVGAIFIIFKTNLVTKITTLPAMFSNSRDFQYTTNDLSGFALASNMLVATEGLKDSKYIGAGLNSHKDTYDKVIFKLFKNSQVILELNKEDAGSLYIRILSEFGLPGIFAFFAFLYYYWAGKKYKSTLLKYINTLGLVIIISYSVRHGSYLSVYFWLFCALYYYSYKNLKNNSLNFNT